MGQWMTAGIGWLVIGVLLGLTATVHAASGPAGATREVGGQAGRYLPITGCAWRLALGDVDGDGRNELVCGLYKGAVSCVDPARGRTRWEAALGGFPFAVAAGDVTGDGKAEVFAACADGKLYAFGPDGKARWVFGQTNAPLYSVGVVGDVVVAGGMDRQVYAVSADGKLVGQYDFGRLVNQIAVGPGGAIYVSSAGFNARLALLRLAAGKLRAEWTKETPDHFWPFSMDAGDLAGDGQTAVVMGTRAFELREGGPVLALNGDGALRWRLEKPIRGPGGDGLDSRGMYTMSLVRLGAAGSDGPGRQVVVATSGVVTVLDRTGKVVGEAASRLSFADLVIDGSTLYLGSTPNGDNTVYRIDLRGDWQQAISTLERQGVARTVGENLARLKQQAVAAPADPQAGSHGPYEFDFPGYNERRGGLPGVLKQFAALYPEARVQLATLPYWMNRKIPAEQFVAVAKEVERERVPLYLYISHGCTPMEPLATLEESLAAGPTQVLGFTTHEDEQLDKLPAYLTNYIAPLADMCVRQGKGIRLAEKNVWYFTMPALPRVFGAMFGQGRGAAYVLCTDDANSRDPELNLLARVGLRQAGQAGHIEATCIMDLFCFNRVREWEQPKTGSPYLRLMVADTVLGADHFYFRTGLGEQVRECTDAFVPMVTKGLVFTPRPEQMAGLSPVGIAVHEPPRKWLEEAYNGHNVDAWQPDPELDEAVLPHNGCIWGNAPTPEHALTRVLFGKQRQFGNFVPATPYGVVVFVPAAADLSKVVGVKEWWHTDGVAVWREGGAHLTGAAAEEALRASFEEAAKALPFRAVGDDVFLQTLAMGPGHYRLIAIDPGWLDPQAREITIKVQLPGEYAFRDVMSGEAVAAEGRGVRVTVPAGSLRVLDAVAK